MREIVNRNFGERTLIFFQDDVAYSSLVYNYRQIGIIESLKGYSNYKVGYPEYFVLSVLEGCLELEYEGNVHTINPGEIAFFDMMVPFALREKKDTSLFYFSYFRGSNIKEFYDLSRKQNGLIFENNCHINERFKEFIQLMSEYKIDQNQISSFIYLIMLELTKKEDREPNIFRAAIKYIEENYQSKINIHTLADLCFFSYYYFNHKFKEKYLATPLTYINNYRFKKAVQLLEQTNMNIEEIAEEVGFSTKKVFVRMCQVTFGMNPSRYRKMKDKIKSK